MKLALYRKYRPKKISDLVGQENIAEVLKNAAKNDRIGHAYLFYGSRGTGKTTTARLIAKLLNCETRYTDKKFHAEGEPCNTCGICKEIDENRCLDIIEIDAASNRGIDEIRNLKENTRTSPSRAHYKVYIIDEAHMLTGAAFNALLKTLEEPPAHAVFVLATTEFDKVPATITSRTQRFVFKKLSKKAIQEKLKIILKEEKLAAEESALELIASAAEGSLRDAESLLEQLAASGEKIKLADVENLTGRTGLEKIHHLVELLLGKKGGEALAYLHTLQSDGLNPSELTRETIHYLRKILAVKTNPKTADLLVSDLTSEEIKRIEILTQSIETEKALALVKAMLRAYTEIRYSPFGFVPLELVVFEHANE